MSGVYLFIYLFVCLFVSAWLRGVCSCGLKVNVKSPPVRAQPQLFLLAPASLRSSSNGDEHGANYHCLIGDQLPTASRD